MLIDEVYKEKLHTSIRDRWQIGDWERLYPWWHPPANVRILMYGDSSVHFNGGSFNGLQYVSTLLSTRAYTYVKFQVDFAHRDGTDPTATIPGAKLLTDLDIMNNYDQVWLFGFNSTPNLTPQEITLMSQFMAAPKFGGVLVTGDHAQLGFGMSQQIPRVGKMRSSTAPGTSSPGYNNTLEEGPDFNTDFDFDEQSDEKPQTIRYRRYQIASGFALQKRFRPHPVLCGPDGPISILPDHQHEGEAVAPVFAAGDPEWPTKAGHQEAPEVVAWGRIKEPSATKYGQEIGVISAYNGHNVDVGRIVADSTWHHWFDINLTGLPGAPYDGFDATPAGLAALKKIDAYFLNCGVWLSPPDKQTDMRNAGWWSIVWSNQVTELSFDLPLWRWGEEAIDALGRVASRCTIHEWIFLEPIFKEKIPRWEWPMLFDRFAHVQLPLEQYVAGGILKALATRVGPHNRKLPFPQKPVDAAILSRTIAAGTEDGLASMGKQVSAEARLLIRWAEGGFRLDALR